MAHFEKVEFPNMPAYYITDDFSHTAELSTEQAYELYAWLHEHSDEMFQALHPETKQEEQARRAWHATLDLPLLPSDYLPDQGDVYVQEIRTGRFTMHRFFDGVWIQWATLSEEEVLFLIEPMQPLGRTQSMRLYYRTPGQATTLSHEQIEEMIQEEIETHPEPDL